MKKFFLVIIIFIISITILIKMNFKKNKISHIITNDTYMELEKLSNAIKNKSSLAKLKIEKQKKNNSLVIDNKYVVFVKDGFYQMKIKENNEKTKYCEIVDAIEMDLGQQEGISIDTCLKTIEGKINIGEISVEFFDNHKLLTVSSNQLARLYDTNNIHKPNDLISIDEINYNIIYDNFIITNISNTYDIDTKQFRICANIWNDKNKTNLIKIGLYDTNKKKIKDFEYQYRNENKDRYKSICIDETLETDNIGYYSILK